MDNPQPPKPPFKTIIVTVQGDNLILDMGSCSQWGAARVLHSAWKQIDDELDEKGVEVVKRDARD